MLERRPLDLEHVTPEMVAGVRPEKSYAFTVIAELVPVDAIKVNAGRRLNRQSTTMLIEGIRARQPIAPVVVYRAASGDVTLLDGVHRLRVSQACGFSHLPCAVISFEDAQLWYRYQGPA